MQVQDLFEGYKKDHKCKTPGAIYSTDIHGNTITVSVKVPSDIELPDKENELNNLEADIHYAIEKVLAKYFKG